MIPGPQELILILLIAVLIFGAKRIPEIMGGLGQGIKSFKKAIDGQEPASVPQAHQAAIAPAGPAMSESAAGGPSVTETSITAGPAQK